MEAESFVSVVTSLATVVGRDFIFFLLHILSANQKLCLWHLTSRYSCLFYGNLSAEYDYFLFNKRWVAAF